MQRSVIIIFILSASDSLTLISNREKSQRYAIGNLPESDKIPGDCQAASVLLILI
jgi:hypothetical protein